MGRLNCGWIREYMSKHSEHHTPVRRNEVAAKLGVLWAKSPQSENLHVDPQWLMELMWYSWPGGFRQLWQYANEVYTQARLDIDSDATIFIHHSTPSSLDREVPIPPPVAIETGGRLFGKYPATVVELVPYLRDDALAEDQRRALHPRFIIDALLSFYEEQYGCRIPRDTEVRQAFTGTVKKKRTSSNLVQNTLILLDALRYVSPRPALQYRLNIRDLINADVDQLFSFAGLFAADELQAVTLNQCILHILRCSDNPNLLMGEDEDVEPRGDNLIRFVIKKSPTNEFSSWVRGLKFNSRHYGKTPLPDQSPDSLFRKRAVFISRLPDERDQTILQRRFDNVPFTEIAQELKISSSEASRRFQSLRKKYPEFNDLLVGVTTRRRQ